MSGDDKVSDREEACTGESDRDSSKEKPKTSPKKEGMTLAEKLERDPMGNQGIHTISGR